MGKAFFNRAKSKQTEPREFTERQKEIIGGICNKPPIKQELTAIIKKAQALGLEGIEETLYSLYEDMFFGTDDYVPTMSVAEARERLQALTPWPIPWKTS